ncbi:MAG: ParB/RepB/Spo0J family partition protein [Candidatus Brocadiia bacterium]
MKHNRLGRGLDALLGRSEDQAPSGQQVLEIPIDEVQPNPNQPRTDFDAGALGELVESITRNGVLQPIIVRAEGDGYQIIAGERRWRAAGQAGLATIPAIVRTASENETLELSLIENIQRQDLNPIEQAKAYRELIDRFALTQEEAAAHLGKKRSSVANILRLLDLPKDIQDAVSRGTLSMGHARALLSLPERTEQRRLAARIAREDLSVRHTERIVADQLRRARQTQSRPPEKAAHLADLEAKLRTALGTRVTIHQHKDRESGRLVIEFFSDDDFQRVLEHILAASPPIASPPGDDA